MSTDDAGDKPRSHKRVCNEIEARPANLGNWMPWKTGIIVYVHIYMRAYWACC